MTIEPIEFTYRAYVQFLKRTSFRIESILAVERAELIASIAVKRLKNFQLQGELF